MDSLIIFGAKYLYLVIVIVAIMYFFRQPKELRWKIIWCAAIALPLSYVVAKISSMLYYDPRPFVVGNFTPLLPHSADNGFPSDHTLLSAAIAATIFSFHKKLGGALMLVAFLVGLSRVLGGVHHMIDILGSMIIASVVTWGVMRYVVPCVEKKIFKN